MKQNVLPALVLSPLAIGIPTYVYFAHQSNTAQMASNFFCVSDLICEGSEKNCRPGSVPVKFERLENFEGALQVDNGPDLEGRVTAVAGQMTGTFNQNNGNSWDVEVFLDDTFTLMMRGPETGDVQQQTFYQGSCERVN